MKFRSLLLCVLLLAGPSASAATRAPNPVTDWATIVQTSIHNATAPRSAGTSQVLHTMVMLAVYDAVVAIEGGYEPYAAGIEAYAGADVRAAIAAAAYVTARARVAASQYAYLDQQYAAYLAAIPDGTAKNDGIGVGTAAATALLERRANDGFGAVVPYTCSSIPPQTGEFEPDTGCPADPASPQPVDVKLGRVKPFTFSSPSHFRPKGPGPLTSRAYARDFAETRDYGRIDSPYRNEDQTDLAYFWSENPYVHWNRNTTSLAIAQGLDVLESARLLAMVHTSVSDAIIAGFDAKYHYRAWRPRTAIPLADFDQNPATDADPTWTPLLRVNHPEYPSGHGFWSTAVVDAVRAFFGTDHVTWTIVTSKAAVPQVQKEERTYGSLKGMMRDIGNSRIFGGLHWRRAIRDGEEIGRHVTKHVTRRFFRPID